MQALTRFENFLFLTWFEEDDGLEAGKLGHVDVQELELQKDFLQHAHVSECRHTFSVRNALCKFRKCEEEGSVGWQTPLNDAEKEQVGPRLFQKTDLQ